MKTYNFKKGKVGEEIAINFLQNKRFKIIEKNYKNSCGEIDIICEFKNMLIFIEVKARKNLLYGKPEEAVTYMKQKRIPHNVFAPQNVKENGNQHKRDY